MELIELIDHAAAIAGSDYKLAKAIEASEGNVNDWRHGRRPCPLHFQASMAVIAGVDARELVWQAVKAKMKGKAKQQAGNALLGVLATLAGFGASAAALGAGNHGLSAFLCTVTTINRSSNRRPSLA